MALLQRLEDLGDSQGKLFMTSTLLTILPSLRIPLKRLKTSKIGQLVRPKRLA